MSLLTKWVQKHVLPTQLVPIYDSPFILSEDEIVYLMRFMLCLIGGPDLLRSLLLACPSLCRFLFILSDLQARDPEFPLHDVPNLRVEPVDSYTYAAHVNAAIHVVWIWRPNEDGFGDPGVIVRRYQNQLKPGSFLLIARPLSNAPLQNIISDTYSSFFREITLVLHPHDSNWGYCYSYLPHLRDRTAYELLGFGPTTNLKFWLPFTARSTYIYGSCGAVSAGDRVQNVELTKPTVEEILSLRRRTLERSSWLPFVTLPLESNDVTTITFDGPPFPAFYLCFVYMGFFCTHNLFSRVIEKFTLFNRQWSPQTPGTPLCPEIAYIQPETDIPPGMGLGHTQWFAEIRYHGLPDEFLYATRFTNCHTFCWDRYDGDPFLDPLMRDPLSMVLPLRLIQCPLIKHLEIQAVLCQSRPLPKFSVPALQCLVLTSIGDSDIVWNIDDLLQVEGPKIPSTIQCVTIKNRCDKGSWTRTKHGALLKMKDLSLVAPLIENFIIEGFLLEYVLTPFDTPCGVFARLIHLSVDVDTLRAHHWSVSGHMKVVLSESVFPQIRKLSLSYSSLAFRHCQSSISASDRVVLDIELYKHCETLIASGCVMRYAELLIDGAALELPAQAFYRDYITLVAVRDHDPSCETFERKFCIMED